MRKSADGETLSWLFQGHMVVWGLAGHQLDWAGLQEVALEMCKSRLGPGRGWEKNYRLQGILALVCTLSLNYSLPNYGSSEHRACPLGCSRYFLLLSVHLQRRPETQWTD